MIARSRSPTSSSCASSLATYCRELYVRRGDVWLRRSQTQGGSSAARASKAATPRRIEAIDFAIAPQERDSVRRNDKSPTRLPQESLERRGGECLPASAVGSTKAGMVSIISSPKFCPNDRSNIMGLRR